MSQEQKTLNERCCGPKFWGVVLPPGESVNIDCPDCEYIILTSACLPKVDDSTKTSRIKTIIRNIPVLDCSSAVKDENPTGKLDEALNNTETETLICTLIPNVCEYQKLEIVLSPLNEGYFKNTGNSEVHLAGILMPITTFDEEEEEEEEEVAENTEEKTANNE